MGFFGKKVEQAARRTVVVIAYINHRWVVDRKMVGMVEESR
jgi:hypothetical protein